MTKKATSEAEQFVKSRKGSFLASFQGLAYVMKTQKNAWIHLAATIIVISVSAYLRLEKTEWIMILLVIGLVWVAEFFNTAFEVIVNLASPEVHPLAKISKDVGAASVLIAAILSVIVGILVLGPAILEKINNFG
ncbi:MAG: diacylglycerol kinase family protein [Anaerolineaceae bacterium]